MKLPYDFEIWKKEFLNFLEDYTQIVIIDRKSLKVYILSKY